MTEDEMVEWHHGLNGREFKQTVGGSEELTHWKKPMLEKIEGRRRRG